MIAATTCFLLEGHGWVTVADLAKLSVKPNLVVVKQSGVDVFRDDYELFDMGEHLLYSVNTAYGISILCNRPQRFAAMRGITTMRHLVPDDELYLYDTGKLFHARPISAPQHTRGLAFDFRLKSQNIQLVVARDLGSRWANTAMAGIVIGDSRVQKTKKGETAKQWQREEPTQPTEDKQ